MTRFPKAAAASSPSRRADPVFAAKHQRVPGADERAARIDRILDDAAPEFRMPHQAEMFLRVCAADGVMIWNGAARFDAGAGAFFALKQDESERFFAARRARLQGGAASPPPALDWDDDGADNGMTAPSAGRDAETEKRHRRFEALRREAESLARKEAAAPQDVLQDARETRAPQDEGKARWFWPAADGGTIRKPPEVTHPIGGAAVERCAAEIVAAADLLCASLDGLRVEITALRAASAARPAPVEAGVFMRELPAALPSGASASPDGQRTSFINGALFGASAAAMIFVLITFGGGS